MINKTPDTESAGSSQTRQFGRKALQILTIPVTAVATWLSADVYMRGDLYKNFLRRGYFGNKSRSVDGTQGEFNDEFRTIVREKYEDKIASAATDAERSRLANNAVRYNVIAENELPAMLKQAGVDSSGVKLEKGLKKLVAESTEKGNAKGRLDTLIELYKKDIREFSHDLDLHNLRDYAKGLTHNQKVEALVFASTTGGITLGVMLEGISALKTRHEKTKTAEDERQHFGMIP